MRCLVGCAFAAALVAALGPNSDASAQQNAGAGQPIYELIEKEPYKSTWRRITVRADRSYSWMGWGPSLDSVETTVDGVTYKVAFTCKIHDCGDNEVYVLFWNGGKGAAGVYVRPTGKIFLGNPNPAQKRLLLSAPSMFQ